MGCKDNTYYAENTQTLMYIILIFLNAAFILFTALTSEPFIETREYHISN